MMLCCLAAGLWQEQQLLASTATSVMGGRLCSSHSTAVLQEVLGAIPGGCFAAAAAF